jgi:hypothetical protein
LAKFAAMRRACLQSLHFRQLRHVGGNAPPYRRCGYAIAPRLFRPPAELTYLSETNSFVSCAALRWAVEYVHEFYFSYVIVSAGTFSANYNDVT